MRRQRSRVLAWSVCPCAPPPLYGVWHGCIVDGVAKLREYLVDKWTGTSLPLVGGGSIYSYDKYTLTAAEYSQSMQVRNVLRWRGTASRNEAIHRGLPGSRVIDHEITKLLRLYFPVLDSSLEKFNGHLLRQYYEADGGSGFGRHIDEADDCTYTLLYLSVAVKLTDDPPGSDGTWMQVEGFQPVRHGCSAGSVVMFLSRWPHWSLRTPPNMGKVLKLVSFYRFREHSQLAAEYAKVAPADCAPLSDNANRAFSVLPQQDSSQPQQVEPVASAAAETQQATEQEWFEVRQSRSRNLCAMQCEITTFDALHRQDEGHSCKLAPAFGAGGSKQRISRQLRLYPSQ